MKPGEIFDIYTDQIIPTTHEIMTVPTSNSQFDSPKIILSKHSIDNLLNIQKILIQILCAFLIFILNKILQYIYTSLTFLLFALISIYRTLVIVTVNNT